MCLKPLDEEKVSDVLCWHCETLKIPTCRYFKCEMVALGIRSNVKPQRVLVE